MNTTILSPDLMAATDALAEALAQAEPVAGFNDARQALDADAEASGLLNELMATQTNARRRQANGGMMHSDIEQLRALQNQAQANRLIMAYVRAQQDAAAYLPGVNVEISQLLGIDFAVLSNTATC
jgi:cell fate (sporulation/competence/biofilm development) regulator YlbF (YheA/YmcA/DUF963 family)